MTTVPNNAPDANPAQAQPTGAGAAGPADRKNRRLGRGLASLISLPPADQTTARATGPSAQSAVGQAAAGAGESAGVAVATPGAPDLAHTHHTMLTNLYIASIEPNPQQPRRNFDQQAIASLAESIRVNGLVQPILVRRKPDATPAAAGGPKFQLVAGERRWRAARLAGLESVPAIVKPLENDAMLELALVENIHREDLNPVDRAGAYQAMMRQRGVSQDELAQRLGENRTSVRNYLRLLDLPESVKDMITAGKLSFGHAKALLALRQPANQARLAEVIVKDDWSVREVEQLVARIPENPAGEDMIGSMLDAVAGLSPAKRANVKPPPPPKPANIVSLEDKLTRRLGTRVAIIQGRRPDMGKLVIDYYCLDDFDRILDALGVSPD